MITAGFDRCALLLRRALVLGLAACLAACATVRIGYEFGDTLVFAWADGYLDFDSRQQAFAKAKLQAWLDWHRHSELPAYVALIGEAQSAVATEVTATDILGFEMRVRARLRETVEREAADLSRLALMLSAAQIDRLERKLAEGTEKARRDRAAEERTLETRTARYVKRLEPWLGDVRAEQRVELKAMLAVRPSNWEGAFLARQRSQAELVRLLRRIQTTRPDLSVVRDALLAWMSQVADPIDPANPARSQQTRTEVGEMLARMLNSADAEQRATLAKRLSGYAEDFRVLVARATPRQGLLTQ